MYGVAVEVDDIYRNTLSVPYLNIFLDNPTSLWLFCIVKESK